MDLEITYQMPHNGTWSVHNVFHMYFDIINKKHNVEYITPTNTGVACGPHSPHIMTIRNKLSKKYYIVSYWDRAHELTEEIYGWDKENLVGIITSSGVFGKNLPIIPFSYVCYSTEFDEFHKKRIQIKDKLNNELFFRGYLHGDRFYLSNTNKIKITSEKIYPYSAYYDELNNNKICLSLNGAAEICNRDIEILSAGSVLLRPKLNQIFHNKLIPDYHYMSYEESSDPELQCDIILEKYNSIKDNYKLLNKIANNGYNWFKKNGTVSSNVNILDKILNEKTLIKLK